MRCCCLSTLLSFICTTSVLCKAVCEESWSSQCDHCHSAVSYIGRCFVSRIAHRRPLSSPTLTGSTAVALYQHSRSTSLQRETHHMPHTHCHISCYQPRSSRSHHHALDTTNNPLTAQKSLEHTLTSHPTSSPLRYCCLYPRCVPLPFDELSPGPLVPTTAGTTSRCTYVTTSRSSTSSTSTSTLTETHSHTTSKTTLRSSHSTHSTNTNTKSRPRRSHLCRPPTCHTCPTCRPPSRSTLRSMHTSTTSRPRPSASLPASPTDVSNEHGNRGGGGGGGVGSRRVSRSADPATLFLLHRIMKGDVFTLYTPSPGSADSFDATPVFVFYDAHGRLGSLYWTTQRKHGVRVRHIKHEDGDNRTVFIRFVCRSFRPPPVTVPLPAHPHSQLCRTRPARCSVVHFDLLSTVVRLFPHTRVTLSHSVSVAQ